MTFKLLFCSDSAVIDLRTNTLSAFTVIEEIGSSSFPLVLSRLTVVSIITRTADEPSRPDWTLRVSLGTQRLLDGPFRVDFQQRLSTKAIGEISGLVIPSPGVLRVDVMAGTDSLASWEIRVNQIGQQQSPSFLSFPPRNIADPSQT